MAQLAANAAAHPNPGSVMPVHRLTRTEYRNSIRDLLALSDLPKEMDFTILLPADNAASGFDNIADLLYVSPANMERYLDAAAKISRLAVGDMAMPVMVNIHPLPLEEPQDKRVEPLPFGTRGGIAIRSYFPLDGEYDIQFDLAGGGRDHKFRGRRAPADRASHRRGVHPVRVQVPGRLRLQRRADRGPAHRGCPPGVAGCRPG